MKKFKFMMLALAVIAISAASTSCKQDPMPEPTPEPIPVEATMEVSMGEIGVSTATIVVKTTNISDYAYQMSDDEMTIQALFGTGTKVTIEQTETETTKELSFTGLVSGVTYKVWFAAHKADGQFYENVLCAEFTTKAYTDTITVVDTMLDGFKVYLKVPEDVKTRGNAVRYTTSDIAFYNYMRYYNGQEDPDMLLTNAQQCTTEDKLITYDDYYSVERDENGDYFYDEYGNMTSAIYAETKVPGEPGYFIAGEFSWYTLQGDDPETGDPDTGPYGWGEGYFVAQYDWVRYATEYNTDSFNADNYWLGYHERIQVDCKSPETFEGSVDIQVYDRTPIDALIRFTPTEDVAFYLAMILEESDYNAQLLDLINNNESYVQWFVTSVFGTYTYGSIHANSLRDLKLSEWFKDTKGLAGKTIRVLVTAMGDNKGHKQSFQSITFTLPEVTLEAPVVAVTPVESDDPYNVTFNIKAVNQDVSEVKFVANYTREFNAILKEYTYGTLLQSMGYSLAQAEIEQINSPEGFNITFSSRENATTRIAVLAYNWEGTSNDPDAPESPAVCESTTPHAQYPTRVESSLFDELVGEWTATANMINYDSEKGWVPVEDYSSDVTIMGGISYPEDLPQEVYDIYSAAGVSKAKTEELWEEFKEMAEIYNKRTRGFNRLLCLGYDFADPMYHLSTVADPYTLFAHEEYGFETVSNIFYDFGPKWNLEIDENGKVWLPINIEREFPLSTFQFGLNYTFYMMGIGMKSYIAQPIYNNNGELVLDTRFPVEVSNDRNTITIYPIEYSYTAQDGTKVDETYYPCVAQLQNGQATPLTPRIAGPVVLKRKSAAPTSAKANVSVASDDAPAMRSVGKAPKPLQPSRSMTPIHESMIKVYESIRLEEPIVRTEEAFHQRAKRFAKEIHGIDLE